MQGPTPDPLLDGKFLATAVGGRDQFGGFDLLELQKQECWGCYFLYKG